MEGRPRFIPPSPEEKEAEMDKRYAEHFAWLKERMMKVKAKIVNSNGTSGIIPVQALPVDHKKKASGDDDDNELVRNEQGELVLKKYLGL